MRLVACTDCRAQFDVTGFRGAELRCHCGTVVKNFAHAPVEAEIHRCGSCGASIARDAEPCEYCSSAVVRDRRKLSLICPECYARSAEDSKFCTSCGVEFRPQPIPDDGRRLDCPCCESAMSARGIGGVQVHECPRCNGLWVPEDHFDRLVERAIESLATRPSHGFGAVAKPEPHGASSEDWIVEYRRCPVCEHQMHRKNFGKRSGVIVDWCGSHGTWLDADELEAIAAFISGGGLAGQRHTVVEKRSKEEMEALLHAERVLGEARTKNAWRRERRHTVSLGDLGGTIGDLLQGLLDP